MILQAFGYACWCWIHDKNSLIGIVNPASFSGSLMVLGVVSESEYDSSSASKNKRDNNFVLAFEYPADISIES